MSRLQNSRFRTFSEGGRRRKRDPRAWSARASLAVFFTRSWPFVRIWSVARVQVRKKYGCFTVYKMSSLMIIKRSLPARMVTRHGWTSILSEKEVIPQSCLWSLHLIETGLHFRNVYSLPQEQTYLDKWADPSWNKNKEASFLVH